MKLSLKIFCEPLPECESRFVITENEAYFAPYLKNLDHPRLIDLLSQVFDLEDPEVIEGVINQDLKEGRIAVGHHDPLTGEVRTTINIPNDRLKGRLKEVFGGV